MLKVLRDISKLHGDYTSIFGVPLGKTENLEFTLEGTEWDAGRFALALYSGLWGYDGW